MPNPTDQKQEPQSLPSGPGIPPPLFTRIGQSADWIVRAIIPQSWMGPGAPIRQSVPEEVRGRQLDYSPMRNLRIAVKDEGYSIHQLRGLVRNCDLAQGAISVIKKQLGRLGWSIQKRGASKVTKQDDTAKRIEEALQYPDHEHPFPIWLGMLAEDQLVADAPSVYRRPAGFPGVYVNDTWGLEIMDPGTIMRYVSSDGRTPFPPHPAYGQILKGQPIAYTTDEILWMPRFPASDLIYGRSETEQATDVLELAIRRQVHIREYFRSGSIPDVMVPVPKEWGEDEYKRLQNSFDSIAGSLAERRKVKLIPESLGRPYEMKEAILKTDFDEILIRKIAFMYDISAGALVREMMRATAQIAKEEAYEQGQETRMKFWKMYVDTCIARFYGEPDYELVWKQELMGDQQKESEADRTRITTGVRTINKVREEHGEEPVDGGDVAIMIVGNTLVRVDSFPNLPTEPAPPPEPFGGKEEPPKTGPSGSAAPDKTPPDSQGGAAEPKVIGKRAKRRVFKSPKTARAAKARTSLAKHYGEFLKHAKAHVIAKATANWPADAEKLAKADSNPADDLDYDILVDLTQSELEAAGKAQVSAVIAQLGTSEEDLVGRANEAVVEYARKRSAEMVGKKWINGELVDNPNAKWAITDATRDGVKEALAKGLQDGLSRDDMAAELEARFEFGEDRADMIAASEVARCNTQADLATWRESGAVMGKMWLLSNDHVDSDECDENAAQGVIPLDELFESGDDAPPNHPRCECSHAAVMMGEGEGE